MNGRILVTGAHGQVGHELMQQAPGTLEVTGLGSAELDITDAEAVRECIERLRPDVIINAAAYTAVDKAESAPEKAYAVNAEGVANLARNAERYGACLLHISTDYVFAGDAMRPYHEEDPVAPINVYGASKLAGEQQLQQLCSRAIILRTSWVFGSHGNNFVKTMLRLGRERDELAVVADQIGCPTSARSIAAALWALTERYLLQGELPWGIYHFSNQPACSWHDFAVSIFDQALALGLIQKIPSVKAIPTSDYPTPARRPRWSVLSLNKSENILLLQGSSWADELALMLRFPSN